MGDGFGVRGAATPGNKSRQRAEISTPGKSRCTLEPNGWTVFFPFLPPIPIAMWRDREFASKDTRARMLAWRFDFSLLLLKSLDLPKQSAILLDRRNLTRSYSILTLSRQSRFFFISLILFSIRSYSLVFVHALR